MKRFGRCAVCALLLCGMLLLQLALFAPYVAAADAVTYTYEFDLAKGPIFITSTANGSYGYDSAGTKVTFTHAASNKYLIYQSTTSRTEEGILQGLLSTKDYTDVVGMGSGWDAAASALGWSGTTNLINISGTAGAVDVTLLNIWSTATTATRGGMNVNSDNVSSCNVQATVRLLGDNRFYRIHYSTSTNTLTSSGSLTFANGCTDAVPGTLTVVGNQTKSESSLAGKYPNNHWDAAIGGDDGWQHCSNMKFTGGIVYAGTTAAENCTAIGGGGNGLGDVTVTGGKIYAVASTTGTALGGGIGHNSYGGDCDITISGGEVYAYNFGQPFSETYVNTDGNLISLPSGLPAYVPGTAIGAGSSINSDGNKNPAIVNISGGYVEAYSIAGCAIGAGNSINSYGGKATVTISGGEVVATSVAGRGQSAGIGIGGGSSTGTASGKRDGGSATITVSGGNIKTTGIGGGTSENGNGGSASVTVTGGTLATDSIGGGFSAASGYADGTVKITGGSVNSEMAAHISGQDGELVFLVQIAMYKNDNVLAGARIHDIETDGIAAYYGKNDIYTDENGMIYLWLPEDEVVYATTVYDADSGQYERYEATQEVDGKIDVKDIGVLQYTGTVEHCYVNIVNTAHYIASTTDTAAGKINGHVILEKGSVFQYYLIADSSDYTITPYHAVETEAGKLFQMGNVLTAVDGLEGVYASAKMTVAANTEIIFNIIDHEGNSFYAFDPTGGSIEITEGANDTVIVSQNGYALTMSVTDTIYLTTGYNPTSNTITVNTDKDTVVNMHIDQVNLRSDEGVINVLSGVLNLTFSDNENLISSSEGSPVVVEADGTVVINMAGMNSARLDGAAGHSAVSGEGTLDIVCDGGFLKLNQLQNDSSVPQFSVGTYNYSGSVTPSFTANLYDGEFSFDLIGYIGPDKLLHSKEELNDQNKDIFTARGLSRIYNGVTDTVTGIQSGNLVLVLSTGDSSSVSGLTLKRGDTVLVLGTDYTAVYSDDSSVCTVTVYGAAFESGNVTILAAAAGKIPYNNKDYSGEYDGTSHRITLQYDADKYDAYFSETQLTADNYTSGSKNTPINKTDAGYYTIYWYLVAKEGTVNPPDPAKGQNVIEILKATNKWIDDLACTDIALGSLPQPYALPKFGTVEYSYYTDREGTPISVSVDALPAGVYYVRADVEGNDNYTALQSVYIRFRVIEVTVFTSPDRSLDQVSGMEHNLQIAGNGAFSARFVFVSKIGMKIAFQTDDASAKPIPDGTKITLIVFGEGVRQYYYYIVSGASLQKVEIPLTDFYLMGSQSDRFGEPAESTSVNYQFCVDFPDGGQFSGEEITFSISAVSQTVQIAPIKSTGASLDAVSAVGGTAGDITVNFTATANPGAGRTAFAVSGVGGTVSLTDENGTVYTCIKVGGISFFDLGNQALNDRSFTLTITGLSAQSYTLLCDIRVIGTDVDLAFSLAGRDATNSVTKTVSVSKTPRALALYAKGAEDYTVIDGNTASMRFELLGVSEAAASIADFSGITATLYVKGDNGYTALGSPTLIVSGSTATVAIPVSVATMLTNGAVYTCRLTFTYGGIEHHVSFLATNRALS